MIGRAHKTIRWLFLILFTLFVSGVSLFTHTHVVNNTKYIHSHPFKPGNATCHDHTDWEMQLLDQIYNTYITSDILPALDLVGKITICLPIEADLYLQTHSIMSAAPLQLRAPPTIS